MQQHRAQLTSSTANAQPGTRIDAARPGICSTPAAGRPGAANRAPEFRGLGGSFNGRHPAAHLGTNHVISPAVSRLQSVTSTAALCSRRTTGPQGTEVPSSVFDSSPSRRHVSGQHLCKTLPLSCFCIAPAANPSALHAVSMILSFFPGASRGSVSVCR